MSRPLKIIILIVLSTGLGVAGLIGVLGLLNFWFDAFVTLERYGTVFAVTTALPIGLLAAVWLDYFLGTGLLPDGMTQAQSTEE